MRTRQLRASQDFDLADGFDLKRALDTRRSFLSLAFADDGRLVLGTEAGGVLAASDSDGDGTFEAIETLTHDLQSVQGLCFRGETLFAIGRKNGESALWRFDQDSAPRALVPIDDADEHGAHGIALGPQGDLFVAVGDEARFRTAPEAASWHPADVPPLLPALADPGGFGARRRFPYGFVARVDPENGEWSYHSSGYRNHYDLAFDANGRLFTCDSDMELDVGLPWYRPVRVVECIPQVDYGARPGSAMWPTYYPEVPAAIAELGRGSPTGLCVYDAERLPVEYRGALILGDWTAANVRAIDPSTGRARTLVQARGALNVTDVAVGPDGAVYFVTGGRGTVGDVYRLSHHAPVSEAGSSSPGERGGPIDVDPFDETSRATALAMLSLDGNREADLFALRWLARHEVERPDAALLDGVAADLLSKFPTNERDVDRELARLLAKSQTTGAIAALVGALERTQSREDAIHFAYCLRAIERGWTDELLVRFFDWFEEAAGWSGGGNFQGYIDAMLTQVVDRCTPEVAIRASEAGRLGPRVLGSFLSRKEASEVGALFEPLRTAFEALGEDENIALAMELKRNLLASLDGARVAGLTDWLRTVHEDEPRLRGACLTLLARDPQDADWERFVRGLEHGDRDVRLACVRALLRCARVPEKPAMVRKTLDQARIRGPRGGRSILRVLAKWSDRTLGAKDGDWSGELAEWERWFTREYPDYARTALATARPRWDFEKTLEFLTHSQDRSGSPQRGAEVFVKATCNTCHTMANTGSGWGPDLTDVAGRFDRRALLEAIVFPSRVIADRYHVTRVVTHDGDELEGGSSKMRPNASCSCARTERACPSPAPTPSSSAPRTCPRCRPACSTL